MSQAPTIVGMHGEYKVPGGKLVVVDTDVEEDRLARVSGSGDFFLDPDDALTRITASLEGAPASSTWAQGDAVVADPVGLHARPAAAFVRLAGTFDAEVTVNGADGGSVLELMALGITQGQSVHIEANGADATAAVAALTDMLESAATQPPESKETT